MECRTPKYEKKTSSKILSVMESAARAKLFVPIAMHFSPQPPH